MSYPLSLASYLRSVERSAAVLVASARRAGMDAPVPTCSGWTVRDVLVHPGIVHRWATAVVLGRAGLDDALEESRVRDTVADPALPAWLATGAARLVEALEGAAANLEAPVFLANAPRPRDFWARRQAHETTVHAVDALSAELGRVPLAAEAVAALGLSPDVAADGIDELLRGFFSRGHRSRLYEGTDVMFEVAPADVGEHWGVRVDASGLRVVDERGGHADDRGDTGGAESTNNTDADAVFSGSAAQLYLGLWNRGDEISVSGDAELLGLWHSRQRVTWS